MNTFEIGKKYTFKVLENRSGLKPFSIVEYENETYYYPGFLFVESDVELIVQKIDHNDNKIYFETDITRYIEDEIISTKLVSVNDENPVQGELILNYKSRKININCPKWMLSEKFVLPEDILLKTVGRFNNRLTLIFIDDIEHYKYVKENTYDFKYLRSREISTKTRSGEIKKTQLILIEDLEDGLIYDAKQNFASTEIIKDKTYSFRYLGLDNKYKPLLVQDEKSVFLNPKKILNEKHLNFINQEHLVNNKLKIELRSQIDNSDNFWLLTMCRYLSEVTQSYIVRNRFLEARESAYAYQRVSGYIISKDFFNSIPKSIAIKTEKYFNKDLKKVDSALDFLNFQEKFEYENLFKDEISFTLDHQMNILNTLFNLDIINRENIILLKTIFINLKEHKTSEEITLVIDKNINRYFKDFIHELKYDFSKKYFLKSEDRSDWLENNQTETVFQIGKFMIENTNNVVSYYQKLDLLQLDLIINFNKGNSNFIHVKSFFKGLSINEFDKTKDILTDKTSIIIYERPIELDQKNAFLIHNDKFIWITSFHSYLMNYFIEQFSSVNLSIVSNYNDTIYDTRFDLKYNLMINQIDDKHFLEDKAIVKAKGGHFNFATYGFDQSSIENNGTIDSIFYEDRISRYLGAKKNSLRIGNIVVLDSENNNHTDKSIKLHPDYKNRYNFDSHGEVFDVIIKEKYFKRSNECLSCGEHDFTYNRGFNSCVKCNALYIDCLKAFIPKLNKYIFLNKNSFETTDHYKKANIGDKFSFLFIEEYEESFGHLENKEPTRISFQKVRIDKFHHNLNSFGNEYSIYWNRLGIVYAIFTLINDLLTGELKYDDRQKLNNINISIGIPLKSPKSYLLQFLSNYDELIRSIRNNSDLSESIKMVKDKIDDRYVQTSEFFPQIKQLFESVEIVSHLDKDDYAKQFQLLNSAKGFNSKLIKSVIINNLIKSEDESSRILNHVNKGIIDLMLRERDEISFNIGKGSTNEVSKEIDLLKDIKNKISTEGQNLEFKETLFVPVLNNSERKRINHLEHQIEKNSTKKEEYLETISEIKKEVKKKIGNKTIKAELAYSAMKNICALLNSNDGKVIIGIRDDNTLVGIEEDIKLCGGDFDGFLQDFENYWKNFVSDSSHFRPYFEIIKITYDSMDFCFINVTYPYDILDPCFMKKDKDSKEICYLKESSTTNQITGKTLRGWKRKKRPQTMEPTYVYLMIDKYENHKIGITKNLKKRQGTLMSQEKSIKLVKSFLFPNRDTALRLENHLHREYDKFRTETGGEWFNIDDSHIDEIEQFLSSQMAIFNVSKNQPQNLTLDI